MDGGVFNEVADAYDRHRPSYPDVLIDRACEVAGLAPGARVLEIGCGAGQLTRSLLARGLRVTAVEPGEGRAGGPRDAGTRLLGTMSFWARLSPGQREALVADNLAFQQRLGRPIRSSTVACLVTARRAPAIATARQAL